MSVSIIPRSTWGAAPPKNRSTVSWTGRTALWVHHSEGTAPPDNPISERAVVRGIQSFHQGPSRGWADIGYGYLVAPSGRIYEGRGYGVSAAHCPGHNDEPSVCLLGSYSKIEPTTAQKNAVWALADHLGLAELAGHREGYSTSCPGDAAMRTLVNAPRPGKTPPKPAKPEPAWPTLRLAIRTAADKKAGRPGRKWAGHDAGSALRWIAKHGLNRTSAVALAHGGNVWRTSGHGSVSHRRIEKVVRTLNNNYSL